MHYILNREHNIPHRHQKPFLLLPGMEHRPPIRSPRGGNLPHRLDGG